jgi:hypothetical protein
LGTWIVFGLILAGIVGHRFQEMTLRQDSREPERDGKPRPLAAPPPVEKRFEPVTLKEPEPQAADMERIKKGPEDA